MPKFLCPTKALLLLVCLAPGNLFFFFHVCYCRGQGFFFSLVKKIKKVKVATEERATERLT